MIGSAQAVGLDIGEVGELSIYNAVHMLAVEGGCRKALVDTECAISLHLCTNGLRNCPSHLVEASFQAL